MKALTVLPVIVGSILLGFLLSRNNGLINKVTETSQKFVETDLSSATQITCTYRQTVNANYIHEIKHQLPESEKNPMIFTFSNFTSTENAQLSYIDATQTITTVPLVKLIDDSNKLVFLEGGTDNYLTTHTIYKKIGIGTYTKNVEILPGIPSVTAAMGSCVGY